MKALIKTLFAVCALSLVAGLASAGKAPGPRGGPKPAARFDGPRPSNLSRDIRFGDSAVYGKYQYANEGTAEVENEKSLEDLLGVRTDFKDRLKLETRRH